MDGLMEVVDAYLDKRLGKRKKQTAERLARLRRDCC